MTVLVSYLKSRGVTRVLEDSSGNAGASLSAYAAAAGLQCRILVPETASYPKIAQIAACGADVVTIRGSRQDVADAAVRMSARDLLREPQLGAVLRRGHQDARLRAVGAARLPRARQRRDAARLRQQRAGLPARLRRARARAARSSACRGSSACRPRTARPTRPRSAPASSTLVPTEIEPTIAEGIASSKPTRVKEVLRGVRESGGGIVAVERGRDRGGAARPRAEGPLRRADLRGGRGGSHAGSWRRARSGRTRRRCWC